MSVSKKRITMKLKRPNPLFELWLKEWETQATLKNSNTAVRFKNALKSLKKYPVPLESGNDCKILNGFGDKLCAMLDKKLEQHKKTVNLDETIIYEYNDKACNNYNEQNIGAINSTIKIINNKYNPEFKSETFAILICLFIENIENNFDSLSKVDVIKKATIFCNNKVKCTSSIKDLLDSDLIRKYERPVKYSLTELGKDLAQNLFQTYAIEINKLKNLPAVISTTNENQTIDIALNKYKEVTKTNSKNDETNYVFAPNTFDIFLLVDNQETSGASNKSLEDEVIDGLKKQKIKFEVRHLKVGDYAWICRDRNTKNELILPYIVERKRIDDFGSSIKDGRFHEQKFRLRQCGIQNVIYLIENFDTVHTGLPITTLYQAATNTLIQDGFSVKFTSSLRGTLEYLACLSSLLETIYLHKTLMSCSKENLIKTEIMDDLIPLMIFSEFNKNAAKSKPMTVTDMFIKQLLQLRGLSIDKVLAIVEKYPTPTVLIKALNECGDKGDKLIANIQYGNLKKNIGPAIGGTIYQFYTKDVF